MIFVKENFFYKIRNDLSESEEHEEILSLEISHKISPNITLSYCYKPHKGDNSILSILLKQVFKISTTEKKTLLNYWRSYHKLPHDFTVHYSNMMQLL